MAHAQRKITHHSLTPEVRRPVELVKREVVQTAPIAPSMTPAAVPPVWVSKSEKAERRAFGLSFFLFGGALVGAGAGLLPVWLGVVGGVGLVLAFLACVAVWSLDNVPSF